MVLLRSDSLGVGVGSRLGLALGHHRTRQWVGPLRHCCAGRRLCSRGCHLSLPPRSSSVSRQPAAPYASSACEGTEDIGDRLFRRHGEHFRAPIRIEKADAPEATRYLIDYIPDRLDAHTLQHEREGGTHVPPSMGELECFADVFNGAYQLAHALESIDRCSRSLSRSAAVSSCHGYHLRSSVRSPGPVFM